MSGMCGSTSGQSAASSVVQGQISVMQSYASSAYNTVLEAVNQLRDFEVDEVSVAPGFNVSAETLEIVAPVKPSTTVTPFQTPSDIPILPELLDIGSISAGNVPTFTEPAPSLAFPDKPAALNIAYPNPPVAPETPEFPEDPDLNFPVAPTMRELNIPTLVTIDLTALQSAFVSLRNTRPTLAPQILDGFNESIAADTYTQYSNIKARLDSFVADNPVFALNRTRLAELLSGSSTGLPSAVETQLRTRAFQSVDDQYAQDYGRVLYEWSAKGHTTNDGVLVGQLTDLRNASRNKKSELSRDIYIQAAEWEIKNLQFAVQQGITWEGVYRQSYAAAISLSKDMAVNLFQAAESIYKARVALYELQLKVFQADIAAFEQWLKVELADLEVYRAQLESAKLINEINAQDIEVYKVRLSAVLAEVGIFKARIDAVNSRIQADAQRIELYKAQLQASQVQADIYKTEWQGYGEAVKGELGRVDIYEALSRAFSERVKAYGTEVDAAKAMEEFKIEQNKLFLDAFRAELDKLKVLVQAETARVTGDTSMLDSLVRLYTGEVQFAGTQADVGNRQFQLELEEGRARAELELKKADLNINQVQRAAALKAQSLDAISRVGAQLTGSAMSAMSVGASLTSSVQSQDSTSCETQYKIDVEQ